MRYGGRVIDKLIWVFGDKLLMLVVSAVDNAINRASAAKEGAKEGASRDESAESLSAFRRRRPSHTWHCSRCNIRFELRCDPKQMPHQWEMASSRLLDKAPWACPSCLSSLLTFPVE
jgi:rubrerythrin